MTLFDLLFLVLLVTTLATLLWAGVLLLRGLPRRAGAVLRRLALGAAAYFAIVVAVSLASAGRSLALGDRLCSDDWCIAVDSAGVPPSGSGRYRVTFGVSSRARRATQRERFVAPYLLDAAGHRHDAVPAPGAPPFDAVLGPGQSIATTREFELSPGTPAAAVVIAREGGWNFPGCCIIGDDNSLLHRRPRVPLDR